MGVYNTAQFPADISTKLDDIIAYVNSLDGMSAEAATDEGYTGFYFHFDGTSVIGFYGYFSNNVRLWLKNGDTYLISPWTSDTSGAQDQMVVHSYVDDNLILLSFRDLQAYRSGMEVALLTIDEYTKLIGYARNATTEYNLSTFLDISTLTFENISDVTRQPLSYTNMFPYAAPAGTLDFLAKGYFVNNGVRKYTSEFIKECSTVNLLSTASLPYPLNNHLAIGAHCIVPLDDEGGE